MQLESVKNNKIHFEEWTKEFPKESGLYWFYGDRWNDGDFELQCVEVIKLDKGGMRVVADGNFMFKSELGEFWFKSIDKIELPMQS